MVALALADCQICGETMYWISCPTGGWWHHLKHPRNNHDGEAPLPINEEG